ncbi:MAG: CinA family protein [Candidatus Omnitrophica bacterium]|nr:CinA family protein [Candidatus Omnitrophota bacterium]
MTLSTAESITAGGIGEAITSVPGASRYYLGGIVAYSNEVKQKLLGVEKKLLLRFGAVSSPVAIAMAKGVQAITGSSCAVSVTGIAGPEGGTRSKPVGLVHVAVVSGKNVKHAKFQFRGNRVYIRRHTVTAALSLLYNVLCEK